MLEAIDACPAPVVARVQGYALGGGAGLVAAADIAIAASDAVFAFSEVKLGIIPAVISPFALAKIGAERRAALLPHGRAVRRRDRAAHRARARGRRRRRRRGRPRARRAPVRGPLAVRWAKRLIRERPTGPETARWIADRRASDEGQEGLRAFLEKRPASEPDGTTWGVYKPRRDGG